MDFIQSGVLVYLVAGIAIGVAATMAIFSVAVAADRWRLRRRIRRARVSASMTAETPAGLPPAFSGPPPGPARTEAAFTPPQVAVEPAPSPRPEIPTTLPVPASAELTPAPLPPVPTPERKLSVEELFAEAFRADATPKRPPTEPVQ